MTTFLKSKKGEKMRVKISECCWKPLIKDGDEWYCSKCGEIVEYEFCQMCDSDGEVIDKSGCKYSINPKYVKCPECNGSKRLPLC